MGLFEVEGFGLSGEDDDICIDLVSGIYVPAQVRGTDWVVPRLDFLIAGNRRKDRYIYPLAGVVKGSGATVTARREDLLANVAALMAVMDPSLGFQTYTLSLGYLGLPTGSTATVEARVRNGAPGPILGYNSGPFQKWTFEIEAFSEWAIGS